MAASTDFLPFATQTGANVESQASYVSDPAVPIGFATGVAQSAKCNKVWRQSSFIASGVAWFTANILGINVADDGNLTNFITNFTTAVQNCAKAVCGTVLSVSVTSPDGSISATVTDPDTTVGLALEVAPSGVTAGIYALAGGGSLTVLADGRVSAATGATVARTSGTSVAPNGSGDAVGTVASSGYDISPDGAVRLWATIQCEDGGNGVYTPSTISFASILPSGVTLAKVSGVKSQNLGAWAGQGSYATRSTCDLMSLTTSQCVVTNQNSDNTGTLTSWYVEVNGHL